MFCRIKGYCSNLSLCISKTISVFSLIIVCPAMWDKIHPFAIFYLAGIHDRQDLSFILEVSIEPE